MAQSLRISLLAAVAFAEADFFNLSTRYTVTLEDHQVEYACADELEALADLEAGAEDDFQMNLEFPRYTVTIEDHHAEYTCADELEALADLAAADVDMGAGAVLAACADVDMEAGADDFDLAHPAGPM